jgi:hypothetical protein
LTAVDSEPAIFRPGHCRKVIPKSVKNSAIMDDLLSLTGFGAGPLSIDAGPRT